MPNARLGSGIDMALNLTQNFKNDIAGRDTNLVPVIHIGSIDDLVAGSAIRLSTNIYTYSNIEQDEHYTTLPLLLNIPSLKESIDIEKRNYKISSINIDISNFPYEGKRFSELVGDTSLINTEVRIYWASPSTYRAYWEDGTNPQDEDFLQIYSGQILSLIHI